MKRFKKTLLFTFLFSLCACTPPKPEPTVTPKEPNVFLTLDENTDLVSYETKYMTLHSEVGEIEKNIEVTEKNAGILWIYVYLGNVINEITISKICVKEITELTPNPDEQETYYDFSNGLYSHFDGAEGDVWIDENHKNKAHIETTKAGTDMWRGCMFFNTGAIFEAGKKYSVSMFVERERKTDFDIVLQNKQLDETGYDEATINEYEFGFSKVEESEEGLIKLTDRGVIINKTLIDGICRMIINFSSLSEATLYYGDYFLSFTNSVKLKKQNTINITSYCSYFVIQSVGESIVKDITIGYDKDSVEEDEELPTFVINTENHASVISRHSYVNCDISYHNPENEEESFDNAPATIKVRGNSTTLFPKFGYRLKFNEKQSFFGLKSNKSWALLADYLDGSKMHNYSALSFAEMVRKNTGTFCVTSHHVRYYLNGKDMGLFLLCEHINENKGRLDIKQDNLWEIAPENINFYVERDFGPAHDYYDVEGEDYFYFNNPDNYPSSSGKIEQYVFALKYPEKEDFYEELEDGSVNEHTQEFKAFFNYVKDYISECALSLANYVKNQSYYSQITDKVDLDSLALFSITDQMFCESDHSQKSFKMYRRNGGKLEFGPNWDYDSCADSMFYSGGYVLNPYEPYSPNKKGAYYPNCKSEWFGENWGYALFKDNINGVKHFKKIWKNISKDMIKEYLNAQLIEMKYIANMLKIDTAIWMDNAYHCVFDNLTFHYKWISTESYYLKDYFS